MIGSYGRDIIPPIKVLGWRRNWFAPWLYTLFFYDNGTYTWLYLVLKHIGFAFRSIHWLLLHCYVRHITFPNSPGGQLINSNECINTLLQAAIHRTLLPLSTTCMPMLTVSDHHAYRGHYRQYTRYQKWSTCACTYVCVSYMTIYVGWCIIIYRDTRV